MTLQAVINIRQLKPEFPFFESSIFLEIAFSATYQGRSNEFFIIKMYADVGKPWSL